MISIELKCVQRKLDIAGTAIEIHLCYYIVVIGVITTRL